MPLQDFRLTLGGFATASLESCRVLGWFTFEAADMEAAVAIARARYGPTIKVIDYAILRPSADNQTPGVMLKGKRCELI